MPPPGPTVVTNAPAAGGPDPVAAALERNTAAAVQLSYALRGLLPTAQRLPTGTLVPTAQRLPPLLPRWNDSARMARAFPVAGPAGPVRANVVQAVRVVNWPASFGGGGFGGGGRLAGAALGGAGGRLAGGLPAALGSLLGGGGLRGAAGALLGSAGGPWGVAAATAGGAFLKAAAPLAAPFRLVADSALAAGHALWHALADPTEGVPALAAKVRPFVEALNPYQLLKYDEAIRDTRAALGYALTPVITALTPIVRRFADTLFPIAAQLAGPVSTAMAGLAAALAGATDAFGNLAADLMPAVNELAGLFKEAGQALGVYVRYAVALGTEIAKAFAPFLKGGVLGLLFGEKGAILTMTKVFISGSLLVSAAIARLVKALSFGLIDVRIGDAIDKALRPAARADTRGLAAAVNPEYKQFADVGREASKNAFVASTTPGGAEEEPADVKWLHLIADRVKGIENLKLDDVLDKFALAIVRAFQKLPNPVQGNGGAAGLGGAAVGRGLLDLFG